MGWVILLIALMAAVAGVAIGGFILWLYDLAQGTPDDRDNPWSLR